MGISRYNFTKEIAGDLQPGASPNPIEKDEETGEEFRTPHVLELLGIPVSEIQTAGHYTKQWGRKLGYMDWIAKHPEAAKYNMGKRLLWSDLFDKIRKHADKEEISVYDGACGFADIYASLSRDPFPKGLSYLGADIHGSLADIRIKPSIDPDRATFVRWDIGEPLPVEEEFDYVVSRGAPHITPDPYKTVKSLATAAKKGGTVAISVYTKKAPMRESVDDALRDIIVPMDVEDGWKACRQLSVLGRDLQAVKEKINISEDLPTLGIKAGEYDVQEFIYDHLIKCWYNPLFGVEHSTVVNFDWYHPQYTFRYTLDETIAMMTEAGLKITRTDTDKYQHYVEGTKI